VPRDSLGKTLPMRQATNDSRAKPMNSHERPARRRRQRGSIAIEVGVTVVLLFGLMFLVMDLAMLVFIKSTLQMAALAGVRTGVTSRLIAPGPYLNDSILKSTQDASLGFLNGNEGACKIQISYYDPATGAASSGTQGDVLVVSIDGFNYTPLGAVLKSADPFAISVRAADIVERCPLAGCPLAANPRPLPCP
jgi:hypothetical protein